MKNIFVLNNRLDESNGTVENVLEMKATKKTPWFLRFAGNLKMADAIAVGFGLLSGSLFLLAEPVSEGWRTFNTCAPVISMWRLRMTVRLGFESW